MRHHTLIRAILSIAIVALGFGWLLFAHAEAFEAAEESITIVDQSELGQVFEFRQNGVLMMIKIIPDRGKPYYMVPADGSPHYQDLSEVKHLYPNWVLLEW